LYCRRPLVFGFSCRLILFLEMVPPAQLFKSRLIEYAQRNSLPLPVYDTVSEGKDHIPQFKSTVTINGAKYESPSGFKTKKASQHAAAKAAIEDLQRQGLLSEFKEKKRPKGILTELLLSKNMPPPTYRFTRTITATVEVNGTSYTGGPANNQRDAANKAAFEAIQGIDPQYCNSLSHVELNANNYSKQLTAECNASKFESKMSADNLASDNQLLGGTQSQSTENGLQKLNLNSAPALQKDSEKTDVENACAVEQGLENPKVKDAHEAEKGMSSINDAHSVPAAQPHDHPQQDPLSAQQGHLKKETGDAYQDKEHESKEMQQISQELDLTESISKRSRCESENAEEMSQIKKKNRMETDGTA